MTTRSRSHVSASDRYFPRSASPCTAVKSRRVALPCFFLDAPPNTQAHRQEMLLPRCQNPVYHFSVRGYEQGTKANKVAVRVGVLNRMAELAGPAVRPRRVRS